MSKPNTPFWKRGIRLDKLPLSIAQQELREAHKKLWSVSAMEMFTTEVGTAAASGKEGWDAALAAMQGPQKILSERSKVQAKMTAYALQNLKNGSLIAYGFEAPRRMDDDPKEIPARLWSGRPDWDKAMLSAEGLAFVEVRVLTKKQRRQLLDLPPEGAANSKPKGRPGVGQNISDAFRALEAAGKVDTGRPARAHFDLVRNWLAEHRPDMKPPGSDLNEETIRKHFSPLFNDLRKPNKQ